jgi:hypothetical protein
MAFPVPPDVRGTRDFELVKGTDEMLRTPFGLADEAADVDVGEWMKPVTSGGVTKMAKLETGVDVLADPAKGAKVSWTRYRQTDSSQGQSDAIATKTIDVLSGAYQAKTKLYNTGSGVLDPGNLLVAVFDAGQAGGILDAVNPAAVTVDQLQAAVGRIIEVANGQLHYECPAF